MTDFSDRVVQVNFRGYPNNITVYRPSPYRRDCTAIAIVMASDLGVVAHEQVSMVLTQNAGSIPQTYMAIWDLVTTPLRTSVEPAH